MSKEYYVDKEVEITQVPEEEPQSPVDVDAEKKELEELLRINKELKEEEEAEEEELRIAHEQHCTNVRDNFTTFLNWITGTKIDSDLYKNYQSYFDDQYRSDLFASFCEFFKDEQYITNEILFYWKCLAISLIRNSKKYKSSLDDIVFDLEEKSTNLRLVPQKCLFRCFVEDEAVCYLKENGNDYYVS